MKGFKFEIRDYKSSLILEISWAAEDGSPTCLQLQETLRHGCQDLSWPAADPVEAAVC